MNFIKANDELAIRKDLIESVAIVEDKQLGAFLVLAQLSNRMPDGNPAQVLITKVDNREDAEEAFNNVLGELNQ